MGVHLTTTYSFPKKTKILSCIKATGKISGYVKALDMIKIIAKTFQNQQWTEDQIQHQLAGILENAQKKGEFILGPVALRIEIYSLYSELLNLAKVSRH